MTDTTASPGRVPAETTAFAVIMAVSVCHLLNDVMQSLLSAIYPMLKADYGLEFWQIGLLTMMFQVTASLLQPAVGLYTDKRPMPYSLPMGMASTLVGLMFLAFASQYALLLIGAVLHRNWFGDIPSRIVARRAHGLGRALRHGAVLLPGRGQFGHGDRSAAGRLHRGAARAGERGLVLAGGASSA